MDLSLEDRIRRYIQTIETEYSPAEENYWQYPPPSYHLTSDYAAHYDKSLIPGEPLIIKKTKKEGMLVAVMIVVASLLIYMVGKKEFGFLYVAFLLLLLMVVLPILLYTKTMIRISSESIWLYKENKEIRWRNVLRSYIKESREEHVQYSFIVHYYDEGPDEFRKIEMELNGVVSPALLSATIEAYKNA